MPLFFSGFGTINTALVIGCFIFAAQATPPRDRPANQSATAVIRGRVVAAATGEPLHRVRVTLNTSETSPPTAVTDTRGQYEMTAPAGSYTITATRAGYLSSQYGQRRRGETGRTVELRAGEVHEGLDLALSRGGVLAGTVSDEHSNNMRACG
jgi:murein DD-endopeptidase MepM/ murein hydrolase activator NlpD